MEIDRRKFMTGMAFAGGAAMGLMLSPAPWYLLRDAAFWTQNWPWVPAPLPGDPSYETGVCNMCDAGCGIKVRKVNERMVRVDGNPDHPVNKGSLCPLGVASLQLVYGPARIQSPLQRVAGRGGCSWQSISWEQAIRDLSARISQLRAAEKSHALACISSHDKSATNELLERLLTAVGSPNFIRAHAPSDGGDLVCRLMQGTPAVAYDIEKTRCVLSFGCSLLEGWGSVGRMMRAQAGWMSARDTRPEIIQIEPNLSCAANRASKWVPIHPGTEAAFALGIAHVLIRDRLYDHAFVEERCFGFKDWKDQDGNPRAGFESVVLAGYAPQAVERITRVPAREIEKVAHQFASHRPAIALGGGGRGDRWPNLYALMAIHSLNALVGSVYRPGGFVHQAQPPLKPLPPVKKDEEARRGLSVPRCDQARSARYPLADSLAHNIDAREIELLLIHETNPHYLLPAQKAAELFEKVPYIISLSPYMDETAAHADLILPLPSSFERWDDRIGVLGFPQPVYNLVHPLTTPLFDTREAGDIAIQLAHTLGGAIAESFPWTTTAEVIKERVEGLYESGHGTVNAPKADGTGEKSLREQYPSFPAFWSALYKNGCWFEPDIDYSLKRGVPGGKFEFYSQKLHETLAFSGDLECMPHYVEADAVPEGFDLLIMPEELLVMACDGLGTPPLLIKQLSDDVLLDDELFVRINPLTAIYKRLNEKDKVVLETPRGRVKVGIHYSTDVREGVVLLPLGFGHTAYDQFLRDKGVNACQLLDVAKDPVSGLLCYRETPGKLRKA